MLESYIFRQISAKLLSKTKAALLWRLSFRMGSFAISCFQPLVNRISIKTLENYLPSYISTYSSNYLPSYISTYNVNGWPVHDNRIKCNLFNEYFTSISKSPRNDYQNLPPLEYLTDQLLLSPVIEPYEVFQVLNRLNPNKRKGFDNLPNRILKICSQSLATPFSLLFNFIFSSEEYPTVWKTATAIPLLKTGSQTEVQNYRPIALLPSLKSFWETFTQTYLQLPRTP